VSIDEDLRAEEYKQLAAQARAHMKYFNGAVLGLGACLAATAVNGPTNGWIWLAGSIGLAFGALWCIVEARYYDLRATIVARSL